MDKEVLDALDHMDPRKASGIDELSRMFYKENWNVVGKDVLQFCNDMLNGNKGVREINYTIIVMIPKVFDPKDMTQFRPIRLCRVIYKIVAKV